MIDPIEARKLNEQVEEGHRNAALAFAPYRRKARTEEFGRRVDFFISKILPIATFVLVLAGLIFKP